MFWAAGFGGHGRGLLPMYRQRYGVAVVPAGSKFAACPTDKAAEYLGLSIIIPKCLNKFRINIAKI
jgi:hypothetical protein